MNNITLDYIKNIKIDQDNPPISNIQALQYLKRGIFSLAGIVESKEVKNDKGDVTNEKCFTPGKSTQFYWSNSNDENDLLLSQFNWFVISCVNYIRIIGLIDIMNKNNWKIADVKDHADDIKKYCSEYAEEVVPELLKWRNKISAHPSITDPKKEDNLGMLEFSLMNHLTFTYPHYYVGSFNWSAEGGESETEKWSLVEVFKNKLIPRYWPDIIRNCN